MVTYFYTLLKQRLFLIVLLIINFFGTIYGYIWYGPQLAQTPARFLLFVPDSPTASLFFTIFLWALLLKKSWPLVEALAVVTLFKYGVWAVVMNVLMLLTTGDLSPAGYMLIFSHGAMAVQGLLYLPFYQFKTKHLIIVLIWTLHNDFIDYVYGMMPSYRSLSDFTPAIAYFTFWLSLVSVFLVYYLMKHKKINHLRRVVRR
ncbi:hypothetical protein HMI01_12880 [Halolactibacillus miurensis]|uniref:Uncharacterized membrane protein YpjA n=1 Tax=Halolactibacillus miurensis TaxID=306541 RepID=A0A1I6SX33_9BACI|nr:MULTISPECIES: DUF1405 domain-containing protein [Halolactibacillus]GEM04300.1 hypothetical protein HMI01_12880 [Halolactibacillus miurensis]SFS81554.1 Uncharacterized membrane protein YpjA [Halolactibacillus miurensis]